MFEVRKALLSDVQEISHIHNEYVKSLLGTDRTFIDKRTTKDLHNIVSEGLSYVVVVDNIVQGYSLFSKYEDGVIGKGIILNKKAQGFGLQRIIYSLINVKYKLYIVCSKYNNKSTRNIVSVGMMPLQFINETDVLYGKEKTHR